MTPETRILIVEDEGIAALDLQKMLTALGYSAPDIVSTGEDAVRKAGERPPDLVLMDIMLQGEIDGVTAAERIRTLFDIPVIYITAYADEATLQRAKITEPYAYLVKPYKERELRITIDMVLYKHKVQKELKESREWLATTLRSIGDAVIATDRDGMITFMNPVAEGLLGWKLDEVLNRKLTDVFNIINRDTRQPAENPVLKVLSEGFTVGLANHTVLITRSGGEIPIDDSAAPIRDDKENIIGVILVFRDITERERLEIELRAHRDNLEELVAERTKELVASNEQLQKEIADRMLAEEKIRKLNRDLRHQAEELTKINKELESFNYTISHDLRAPLRTMNGFSQMILNNYQDKLDDEGKEYLQMIRHECNRMGDLIKGLLNLSRLSRKELRYEEVDLSAIVEAIVAELQRIEPEREADFIVAPGIRAKGDRVLLESALQNLLDNAWKFTGKHEKARIEFGVTEQEGKKAYFVRDDGAGFDMKYVDKLFGIFQRIHRADEFPGNGIGLAITQRIVHHHGGQAWAEGEVEKGATFYFTLREQSEGEGRNEP